MKREVEDVPDWALERLRLGELPAEEIDTLRRAAEGDARIRQRLGELDLSDAEILAGGGPGAPPSRPAGPG